jgi:NAD(P)H dehydrogenase (quinone)
MLVRKILIINGHPDKESFCFNLAETYKMGAEKTGASCRLIHLNDLDFNPNLQYGYRLRMELEPDLLEVQQDLLDSDHLVFIYPTWWGTYPAILKGFIDRVFLPNFAYKSRKNSLSMEKLLKGKSARLIVTMDSPKWYYSMVYKSPGHNSMKNGILKFCGIKPVKITTLGPIKSSDYNKRKRWIDKVERIGRVQK